MEIALERNIGIGFESFDTLIYKFFDKKKKVY
jgi:hypothetical protein